VAVGDGVGVGEGDGVGVDETFWTSTLIEEVPTRIAVLEKPFTEIKCEPFVTVLLSQRSV
jgi:hypothetical protein